MEWNRVTEGLGANLDRSPTLTNRCVVLGWLHSGCEASENFGWYPSRLRHNKLPN